MANVIVLFEVTIKEGRMDDYLNMAASLKEELAKADGFIGSERFESLSTKGKLLSKSEWKDEESVTKWRNMAKHRMCQKAGREHDFIDYKITVVTPICTNLTKMLASVTCLFSAFQQNSPQNTQERHSQKEDYFLAL